jgi:hypothetical protein
MKKYQQGDVLFVEVPEGKWDFKQDGNKEVMIPSKNKDQPYQSYGHKRESQSTKDVDVITVAHGEATGHTHSFRMSQQIPGVAITAYGGTRTRVGDVPEFIKITGDSAVIKHEEHNALTIPAGHYKVGIVREFDHISGISRYVVD